MPPRAYSWSQHSSFLYSEEQWYKTYVLGIRGESREMDFGKEVDQRIQDDSKFLPELPRYPVMQLKLEGKLGGLPLIGYADGWDNQKKLLADYKTGKKPWTQKRADDTGQLTFYALLLYLMAKIKPEDIRFFIHWLPTQENGDFTISFTDPVRIETFETKRTTEELMHFINEIKSVRKEMAVYAAARRKSQE